MALAGNGAGGDLLHLLVQHMDRGLRRDDEVADQHGDGDQHPAVAARAAMVSPR